MANAHVGRVLRWDTLTGAASPWKFTKVVRIEASCPLTGVGGQTTLIQNGVEVLDVEVLPGERSVLEYPEGYNMKDLQLTALGTDVVVAVEYQ